MRRIRPVLLLLFPLLAGCSAEPPFLYKGEVKTTADVDKKADDLVKSGSFQVCHATETPMSEVIALAQEQCASYGLQTWQGRTQKWQCRISASSLTYFSCYDPQMTDGKGGYINPFDQKAVAAWETRTGRKAKLLNPRLEMFPNAGKPEAPAAAPSPAASSSTISTPDSSPSSAPAATPVTEAAPTAANASVTPPVSSPASAAPAASPSPVQKPAAAKAPADSVQDFSLHPGSWGDAFEQ